MTNFECAPGNVKRTLRSWLAAVDPTNPQTWNRYAYAVNNPLALVDPQGLCSHDEANEENGEGAGSSGEANPDSYCVEIDEGIPGYEGGGDNIGPCPNNPQDFCLETADGQEIDLGPRLYEIPGVGFNDCDQQCQLELTYDTWWTTNAMGPVPYQASSATNSGSSDSFLGQWWNDVKNCVGNYGLPAIENALNPASLGAGTVADAASQMSQASLQGAAMWSVKQGLTVPLRSSIVRAGVAGAETFGKVSVAATGVNIDFALLKGVIAEARGCL